MTRANYPRSVQEVLVEGKTYRPAALAAVRRLRRNKPWQGTDRERLAKFSQCLTALARAYRIPCPLLIHRPGAIDSYRPGVRLITLGKFSVVTLLHEFAHARGMDERGACTWSINLFRRVFPRSWSRCRFAGHVVLRSDS